MVHIYKLSSSTYKPAYEEFGEVAAGFELSYPVIDKDRIFNLKIFDKDDKIILEKTITLQTSLGPPVREGYENHINVSGWTSKVVVEPNDKYVKEININNRSRRAFRLEL